MKYDVQKRNPDIVELKREYKRRKQTTESPERVYFCWFLSLKLLLEVEEKKLKINGIRIIDRHKIDREFYKEWNLDALLHLSFYKWWEMHKTLFEPPPIVERDNLKDWVDKPHYRYLRVDLRNNYTNIMKGVKGELEDLKGLKVYNKTRYPVTGKPRYDNEILSYNIMVRMINKESIRDIFEQEIDRFKVVEQTDKQGYNELDEEGESTIKKSKLMTSYDELHSLSPEQRKISKKKVRRGIMDEREEEKYYLRNTKSLGLHKGIEYGFLLNREINRYIKGYKQTLLGVSKGQYRKPIKF